MDYGTGAIDHISCDSLFIDLKLMIKFFMSMLNGHKIQVEAIGTIDLSLLLIFHVFFVLDFNFNMLSASKLIATKKYVLFSWLIIASLRSFFF